MPADGRRGAGLVTTPQRYLGGGHGRLVFRGVGALAPAPCPEAELQRVRVAAVPGEPMGQVAAAGPGVPRGRRLTALSMLPPSLVKSAPEAEIIHRISASSSP